MSYEEQRSYCDRLTQAMSLTGLSAVELEELARRERMLEAHDPSWAGGYHLHVESVRKPVSEAGLRAIQSILAGQSAEEWRREEADADEQGEA